MSESGLTRKLHDLLHREAHLKLCRAQLTPVWTEKEAELRALQATRPPFMAILSRKVREDHRGKLSATEQSVERMRQRMEMLDLCEPHIARMIEEEIESLLRESCPEYIESLAALRQKEDWLRCLERFGAKIFEFTRALGNVRNLACSGYARQSNVYSSGALQAFGIAYEAAQAVEEEVRFANRISDAQLGVFRANGIQTKPLPRLPEPGFTDWVNRIKALPLAEAQVQFDALIDHTKRLHDTGIPELRAQADQVQHEQTGDIRNFLHAAWEQFRAEVAPEIFPGDTERLVADTERMLTAAARASVTGRL
ncbi:MAG: hypothetical protein HZC55_13520 [Verrucomicrobia bacterium]|nr:hypothetical protein [Verrucomicrobiota bacterium]